MRFFVSFFLLLSSTLFASGIPAQDARNTDLPGTDTHFVLRDYPTLAGWEQRKAQLRKQVLTAAGLYPMPSHAKPQAQIFGRLERKGYSIEKVLLETMPGFYVGGNLYRPLGVAGKRPIVLNPHGHWPYGRLENEPLNSPPSFGINMARQGYVVFAWDMLGYNDTVQTPHRFGSPAQHLWSFTPLGLQLWNSIRALDFVSSLPDVDPENLGVVGPSGGATQTMLLAAVDDRVKYSAPVNMVSAIMQGGDFCENAPGLRIGANNVEIAAMVAPKPMLLVSATGDWTKDSPQVEYPAIQKIYALYGKRENVESVHLDALHNFNQQNREAVYRFFGKWMLGAKDASAITERNISPEMLQDMLALAGRPLPAGALTGDGVFAAWKRLVPAPSGDAAREQLRLTIPVAKPARVASVREGNRLLLGRPEARDRIPAIWIEGKGVPVLVVGPQGAESARQQPETAKLLASHRPVLLIDAFQTGSAVAPRDESPNHFLTFNVSKEAGRVQDIVTALTYLHQQGAPAVELLGLGDAAVWAAVAAAAAWEPVKLLAPPALGRVSEDELLRTFPLPGIERFGGLAAVERLLPR